MIAMQVVRILWRLSTVHTYNEYDGVPLILDIHLSYEFICYIRGILKSIYIKTTATRAQSNDYDGMRSGVQVPGITGLNKHYDQR